MLDKSLAKESLNLAACMPFTKAIVHVQGWFLAVDLDALAREAQNLGHAMSLSLDNGGLCRKMENTNHQSRRLPMLRKDLWTLLALISLALAALKPARLGTIRRSLGLTIRRVRGRVLDDFDFDGPELCEVVPCWM